MGQAVPVRTDYTASEVRRFAKRAKDRSVWHLRPCSTGFRVKTRRSSAGWIARRCVTAYPVQPARADGPINLPSPGAPSKLDDTHKAFLRRIVEENPIPAVHGVVCAGGRSGHVPA